VTDWNTLYDKIVVQRHAPDKAIAGIDVAPAHETLKNKGIILKVGTGRLVPGLSYPIPLVVQVGQEVLFHEHAGINLEPDDDSIIILREDEILAFRDVAGGD